MWEKKVHWWVVKNKALVYMYCIEHLSPSIIHPPPPVGGHARTNSLPLP